MRAFGIKFKKRSLVQVNIEYLASSRFLLLAAAEDSTLLAQAEVTGTTSDNTHTTLCCGYTFTGDKNSVISTGWL